MRDLTLVFCVRTKLLGYNKIYNQYSKRNYILIFVAPWQCNKHDRGIKQRTDAENSKNGTEDSLDIHIKVDLGK